MKNYIKMDECKDFFISLANLNEQEVTLSSFFQLLKKTILPVDSCLDKIKNSSQLTILHLVLLKHTLGKTIKCENVT